MARDCYSYRTMNTPKQKIPLLLLAGWLACTSLALADEWTDLGAGVRPSERLVIGGQPTAELLREAAKSGIKVVVNLRSEAEDPGYDEAALAAELGLAYLRVPVDGPAGLAEDNVRLFDAVLDQVGDEPVLMHCSTGNRVGAMFALHAARYRGLDTEAAIEFGEAHGLTHFADEVRAALEDAKVP